MDQYKVTVYRKAGWEHVSVLLVGFNRLKQEGIIDLEYLEETDREIKDQAGLRMTVNGKKCYLDVTDGYNNADFMKQRAGEFSLWFKRSFSAAENEKYGFTNVVPLGLNYAVYDEDVSRLYTQKADGRAEGIKGLIKESILGAVQMKRDCSIFEKDLSGPSGSAKKEAAKQPKICFTARLWENDSAKELNEMRIEMVRALKNRYREAFVGGIYDSELSRKMCPDLIVGKLFTQKSSYLRKMHGCDICIATTGLHRSIGFKFAEYVIAGKAIISEPLNYEVPYGFEEGKNYLTFRTTEEALDRIDYLLANREVMRKLSENNLAYYRDYLNPKDMILCLLKIAADPERPSEDENVSERSVPIEIN